MPETIFAQSLSEPHLTVRLLAAQRPAAGQLSMPLCARKGPTVPISCLALVSCSLLSYFLASPRPVIGSRPNA
jgi:hypothetical protein